MTAHLQRAFEEASKLPTAQQDALGDWILAELESERQWDEAFAQSQPQLERLAAEALAEYRLCRAEPEVVEMSKTHTNGYCSAP